MCARTHRLNKLSLIIKVGLSSEHVSVNTNAMEFVNKSLSSEFSYSMSILLRKIQHRTDFCHVIPWPWVCICF